MRTSAKPVIVVVDDDPAMVDLVATALGRSFTVHTTTKPTMVGALLREKRPAVLLTDQRMGGMTGLELCRLAHDLDPELPVVMMTAFGSLENAVEAMRAGAFDYVTKPIEMEALEFAIERAAKHHRLITEIAELRAANVVDASLVGSSPAMERVRELVGRLAASDVSVLLLGESGTGKEVTARAIHEASARRHKPFVAINCAALPEALLESELFGHAKGAFTDARVARTGLFIEADGGTLFLDEIGDMPIGLQPKLLRALESRKVRPLGATTELGFDVRVLSATHRDLESAIAQGAFREDLFYRLNVVELTLPPLRARGDDVLLLAQLFLQRFAARSHKPVEGFGPGVAERLLGYGWPGNVRELSNAMERAVALTSRSEISVDDLPERVRAREGGAPVDLPGGVSELTSLEEMEQRYILRAFELLGKNRSLTAQTLQIDRKTLYRKLEKWGVGS
ncbi:MAG: sigma-54 dependent transcriptional regulator [Polyangiaceae bacterium]